MGKVLALEILADEAWEPADFLDRPDHPDGGADLGDLLGLPGLAGKKLTDRVRAGAEVVVDFSSPAGLAMRLLECREMGLPLVSGTTGIDPGLADRLREAASEIPVLHSPNMSLGVNLLFRLAADACRALAGRADAEIIEAHHGRKVDAPSGTAAALLGIVQKSLHAGQDLLPVHGRSGSCGPREPKEIGVHAVRGGTVTGEHTLMLLMEGERIELTHRAENRSIFASGALWAAARLLVSPPGFYTMDDLLKRSV
jgi:4-hydroxy-tetrahydrodipicolinate reductase